MNSTSKEIDVCIVGSGFAGMNAARLLAQSKINCEIISSGFGASDLWVGTIDFLKFYQGDLETNLEHFKKQITHPYTYLSKDDFNNALNEFFYSFPEFTFFKRNNKFVNNQVLTTIGNLKPCVGVWKTILTEFEIFQKGTTTVIVDFLEFNNSAMDLVQRSLSEKFEGNFFILKLSFIELLKVWGIPIENSKLTFNLTESKIAEYFDQFKNINNVFVNFIKSEVKRQLGDSHNIICYLFPPVIGLEFNQIILDELSNCLEAICRELVAFSPSLMSKRFIKNFESKLSRLSVKITKGYTLVSIQKENYRNDSLWILKVLSKNGKISDIKSKYVIFAMGSMFQNGLFNIETEFKQTFKKLSIKVPNKMTENYELTYNNDNIQTGLYSCGAAIFTFIETLSDEQEIKYNTGLGLAICSSMKVANEIIKRLRYTD